MQKKWVFIVLFLVSLTFMSYVIASFLSLFIDDDLVSSTGNVGLIPVTGVILFGDGQTIMGDAVADAKELVELIKKADANPELKALLLDITSPGGSAVASQEVAAAVLHANKTVYAYIREQGTSGAYWIASAADKVIANELALIGSIGVISSYLEFSGLLHNYNVSYQRLVAGKYKDIGTPFRKLTSEEEAFLQKRLDMIHDRFISAVADNRKLPKEKIVPLATGLFYLGSEAKELGLVDDVGDMDYVTDQIKKEQGLEVVHYVEYKKKSTWLDTLSRLSSTFGFWIGRGIATPKAETVLVRT